jgi:hypothetical protein
MPTGFKSDNFEGSVQAKGIRLDANIMIKQMKEIIFEGGHWVRKVQDRIQCILVCIEVTFQFLKYTEFLERLSNCEHCEL